MTIRLDHTIVPAKDKMASAEFFAEIFGLTAKPGYFAQVQVNESLTLDVWGIEPARLDEARRWLDHIAGQWDEALGRLKESLES